MTDAPYPFGRPQGVAHLQKQKTADRDAGDAEADAAADPSLCMGCGARLSRDDIGLTKKLINRGAKTFLCKRCLAGKFQMTIADCDNLIEHFRASGCHFFL